MCSGPRGIERKRNAELDRGRPAGRPLTPTSASARDSLSTRPLTRANPFDVYRIIVD